MNERAEGHAAPPGRRHVEHVYAVVALGDGAAPLLQGLRPLQRHGSSALGIPGSSCGNDIT